MKRLDWHALDSRARIAALKRPARTRSAEFRDSVARIIECVRRQGDEALRALTREYDGCDIGAVEVSRAEIDAAQAALPDSLKTAIGAARERIEAFHRACAPVPVRLETAPGVVCERILRPISSIGLYVPAGSAPLPSTALMLGVPAKLADCRNVVLCTPPRSDGRCDEAVLHAAGLCGVERIFRIGGAQAIAAMACGTSSVPRCDKVFGPGNRWVTEAKQQIAAGPDATAIDMPAGPSEVLVIADDDADAGFVAADLLSQAEHGGDSQVLLLSPSVSLLDEVSDAVEAQRQRLPRASTAAEALAESRAIRVESLEQAADISNTYAPEHLILNVARPRALLA
ncbi:MAG: histidinol dehydrogenase, partial [Steroidobacteraceae bacterium]